MSLALPEIGLIVVGDEILSGRRQDRHVSAVIERLAARGLALTWARYEGDDQARLIHVLRETMDSDALVFCCGGIGATPDDVTRQAAGAASGRALVHHPEGREILRERFGDSLSEQRLRMVEFPQGAALIPNPVNRIPGFHLEDHAFVPGFPRMAWPMIEWVLDVRYPHLTREPPVSRSVRVRAREGDLIDMLEELGAAYPDARFSSLPEMRSRGYVVELGVRGPAEAVEPAFAALENALAKAGMSSTEDGD